MRHCILGSVLWLLAWQVGWAQDRFAAGASGKAAGWGTPLGRGLEQLFFNPSYRLLQRSALESTSPQNDFFYEIGYGSFFNSYEHPDFDPVKLWVNTPLATAGFAFHPHSAMHFSFGLLPKGLGGEIHLTGFPRRIGTEYQSIRLQQAGYSYDLVINLGYRLSENLALSIQHLRNYESNQFEARQIENDAILYKSDMNHLSDRIRLGWSYLSGDWVLGGFVINQETVHYKGQQKSALSPETEAVKTVFFKPRQIALESKYRGFSPWAIGLAVQHENWGQASDILREGVTDTVHVFDIQDSWNFSFELEKQINEKTIWCDTWTHGSLFFHLKTSPYGDGRFSEPKEVGADFGKANNTTLWGTGIQIVGKTSLLSFLFETGKREVNPQTGFHPGFYESTNLMLAYEKKISL